MSFWKCSLDFLVHNYNKVVYEMLKNSNNSSIYLLKLYYYERVFYKLWLLSQKMW